MRPGERGRGRNPSHPYSPPPREAPGCKAGISLPSPGSGAKVPSKQLPGQLGLFSNGNSRAALPKPFGAEHARWQQRSATACWQEQPQQSQAPETSGRVIDGEMTGSVDEGRAVEVVYLGFGKAFDARRAPGQVLGPRLCNTFVNDLEDGTECSLSKSAEDAKPGGVVGTPEGCATVQRALNRPESWTNRNRMEFAKGK
ncbi:hypothetical protein QYF61_026204 [Mycteria americana]|uniref:Uncharacterized protein n=1 Tax=Mycteria americana TaxID=33587 RepID=A0AAN7RPU2_MYCAM|nr:hypothetical protein QYF61_026204 [Mycteria americana]